MKHIHWIAFISILALSSYGTCEDTLDPKEYMLQQGVSETETLFLSCTDMKLVNLGHSEDIKWPDTALKVTLSKHPEKNIALIQQDVEACPTYYGKMTEYEIYGECKELDVPVTHTININRITGEFRRRISTELKVDTSMYKAGKCTKTGPKF